MLRTLFERGGMLLVLLALCALFSVLTWSPQQPVGTAAAQQLARRVPAGSRAMIIVRDHPADAQLATVLERLLAERGAILVAQVRGGPAEARAALQQVSENQPIDHLLVNDATSEWGPVARAASLPGLHALQIHRPQPYYWPNFLKVENLLNIANQIAVIAIVAIGMTCVIIAGQIDLSVGSLIALAAVMAAVLIRDESGGEQATVVGQVWPCAVAIGMTALLGLMTGALTVGCRVPSFIVSLAMMLMGNGAAYLLAQGQSINQLPESFVWLGRGADVLGIPHAVLLLIVLYAAAHFLLTRTVGGRWLYAVGGNPVAAFYAGIPTGYVTMAAFTVSGAMAGLGGVVLASQLRSGSPTYGQMYELYVIAAVVVGGASLSGGSGQVLGTLVGALIIAVIQNGMNLLNIESYTQKVVLGVVILLAVLLDRWRAGSRSRV